MEKYGIFLKLTFLNCDSTLWGKSSHLSFLLYHKERGHLWDKGTQLNAKEGKITIALFLPSETPTSGLPPTYLGTDPMRCFDRSSLVCLWKAPRNSKNNFIAILTLFFLIKKNNLALTNSLISPFPTFLACAHINRLKWLIHVCIALQCIRCSQALSTSQGPMVSF